MSDFAGNSTSGPGRALIPFTAAPAAAQPSFTLRQSLWGAGLILAFATGAFGVHQLQVAWAASDPAVQQAQANARLLSQLQGEIGRLKGSVDTLRTAADGTKQDESLRTLHRSVETLKAEIDQVRTSDGAGLAQISTKIDKADHDPSQKLADIVARLDRIERVTPAKAADAKTADAKTDATAPKVADLASRLDRLEKQVASPVTTGSVPSAARATAPANTTSVPRSAAPSPKADAAAASVADARGVSPKPAVPAVPTLNGWIVRDVYDGMALLQGRDGGLREVEPGEYLPGAGQVRSIERRGRGWVVLTSRGLIQASVY